MRAEGDLSTTVFLNSFRMIRINITGSLDIHLSSYYILIDRQNEKLCFQTINYQTNKMITDYRTGLVDTAMS